MSELQEKTCEDCGVGYSVMPEDLDMYAVHGVPAPARCPDCRFRYLLSFWNFGRFRIAKSALSGQNIITVIPETAPFPIISRSEFVAEEFEALEYGIDYDPSQSFFEQVRGLQAKVPHPHNLSNKNINSDWCDDVWESRECYLCRSLFQCEFVSYGYRIVRCKNSIDITYCFDSELCYDCLNCFKCYRVRHAVNSRDCIDSAFIFDCRGSSNLFMCHGLRNKQYCIYNEQYSKEDYFKKLEEFDTKTYTGLNNLKEEFRRVIREEALHRANLNIQCESSSGNFLNQDRNCYNCYFLEESENSRHVFRGIWNKDSIDCIGGICEKSVMSVTDMQTYDVLSTYYCVGCRYSGYLDNCDECEYCFGCVGLRKKKYCILNKQYSKKDYEELRAQIVEDMKRRGEWGRYFPSSIAYSGYNNSIANAFFPLSRDNAEKLRHKWDDVNEPHYDSILPADDLPETIEEASDDITKSRILCPETKLSYNIAPRELAFYREQGIPLPRRHFDHRTFERFRPMALMIRPQKGACNECKKEITHYYDPKLGYKKILCVECYQAKTA